MVSLGHPEFLLPYPVALGHAVAGLFVAPDWFCYLCIDGGITLAVASLYLTTVMFVFRFAQTSDSCILRLLSVPSYAVPISTSVVLLASGAICIPLHAQWGDRRYLLDYMREHNALFYRSMLDSSFVGFVVSCE